MVAGLAAIAAMLPLALDGREPPRYTPPAGATEAAEVEQPTVAFLGDSYMAGSGEDSGEAARWPAIVSEERGWQPLMFATGGTGFTTAGSQKGADRFADRVPRIVAAAPDTVIVGGGANDAQADPAAFEAAVSEVLSGLRAGLPDARLIVLSPFWRAEPPESVLRMRDVLAEQAAVVDGTLVDVSGLFADGDGIGADGVHPTDAGHARIAEILTPQLSQVG